MPRYDDSPRDRSPLDRGRDRGGGGGGGGGGGRMKQSPDRRRPPRDASPSMGGGRGPPMSRDPYDDYPPPPRMEKRESIPYKILCVANLNNKVSDGNVRDALARDFQRWDVSVKVCHDANERFAYIYFRSYEEAREARHAKSRLVLFDKSVEIDPIYERLPARRRSVTPDYGPPPQRRDMRGVSPGPRRAPPPPPQHAMRGGSRDDRPMYSSRDGGSGRSHPSDMHRGGGGGSGGDMHGEYNEGRPSSSSRDNSNSNQRRDSKKEKFPNYLHHVAPEEDDKATRTLFVGNLEVTITDAELRRIFERYGVVEDIDVKRPPPGQGNAYAFIKFLNLDMGHRAKVEMSGQYVGKFQCKIGYGKATPTTRIWVGGLGPWTSLAHLEREFDRFGAIRKIDFVKGDNHAYIQYDSIDAAQAACQEMRGFPLGGQDKRLRVDFADPGPYNSANLGSPSQAPTAAASDDPYYDSAPGAAPTTAPPPIRRSGENNGPENSTWREGSPGGAQPPARYRGEDGGYGGTGTGTGGTGDSGFNENNSNGRSRSNRPGPGEYQGDGEVNDKLPKQPPRVERSGDFNNRNDREWFDDQPGASPNGRAPKRPTGRTPEGDVIVDRKGRRSPLVLTDDIQRDMNRALSSPMHSRPGARSPSFEDGEDRTVVISESVSTVPELMKCCPPAWNGGLILKNNAFAARMLLCSGDLGLVNQLMVAAPGQEMPMLRITQRLRLDPSKLEDVSRRMTSAGSAGHSMLLTTAGANSAALAAGTGEDGGSVQQRPLRNLVSYLKQKEAAGVISLNGGPGKDGKDLLGVLYAFPPCTFANDLLRRVAPKITPDPAKEDYLVVVVVRGTN